MSSDWPYVVFAPGYGYASTKSATVLALAGLPNAPISNEASNATVVSDPAPAKSLPSSVFVPMKFPSFNKTEV